MRLYQAWIPKYLWKYSDFISQNDLINGKVELDRRGSL